MKKLLHTLKKYKSISIIGMDKNVGKTTTLNYIINETEDNTILGLTSIGRDGEEEDVVTSTHKPRIYIRKNTYIATAKSCFLDSDVTKEIIATTGINTPMGEIVIFKALSDGYVQLAGPSFNYYLEHICSELQKLGCDIVIADGAISRKSLASPSVTKGTILCTGASLNKNIYKVVEQTAHSVKLLSTKPCENEEILKIAKEISSLSKVSIIDKHKNAKKLDVKTALDSSKEIIESLDEDSEYVVINGILGDKLLDNIMKNSTKYKGITFLVQDGTKLFLSKEVLYKFEKTGGRINSLSPINIICITANPKSPFGYEFDKDKFLGLLKSEIDLPVFDILGGE
jgi:hypothetical protein